MLSAPRYLQRDDMAADVQLQQFVLDWCRGPRENWASAHGDRHRSLDLLLRETTRRFAKPVVVETGTIRAEEDWGGAGFFTYLMGRYLSRRGGKLFSVDLSLANCQFSREWTGVFGEAISVVNQDSVDFLRQFAQPIDVLYLDSLDTSDPDHAQHALSELQAALSKLHSESLIMLDDTPWIGASWVGKGALAVPFLLERGWKILYAGYQVLLQHPGGSALESRLQPVSSAG
jgi:hypothetical protein